MEVKDIIHPEDAKAIKVIKGIPGLEKAIACFMKFGFEQQFRGENLGNMTRIDAWNYPVLYHDFQELVKKLGIREPELYIYNSPYMNAYTYVRALEVERWRYSFQYRHLFSLTRSLRYEINK